MSRSSRAAAVHETHRPAWLPPPPRQLWSSIYTRPRRRPRFTLCSVAIGEPYESHLEQLRYSAAAAGFDRAMLWKRADVMADPLLSQPAFKAAFATMHAFFQRYHHKRGTGHFSARPFCAAFKPVVMWRALIDSSPGDYVLWADASQYARNVTLLGGLQEAVALLTGGVPRPPRPNVTSHRWRRTPWFTVHERNGWTDLAVRSVYGLLTCSAWDCAADLYSWNGISNAIARTTMTEYADLIGDTDLLQRPLILNSNILLERTAVNQLLVWDWMHMAVERPSAFCMSHIQDQAAWTILVLNRSLPLVNFCPYLHAKGPNVCVHKSKNTNTFIDQLRGGRFEIVTADEIDGLRDGYVRSNRPLPVGNVPLTSVKKAVQGCVKCR